MLDPSLPWLAKGYRNFKQHEVLRPRSAVDSAHHQRYLEMGSNHPELRPTTPARYQQRRVKSATHVRVHGGVLNIKHRLQSASSARPRSARSTGNFHNEKAGCYNYSPEDMRTLSRRPKSASAVLLRKHRPSAAQNKSVTQVERLHHDQQVLIREYEAATGEEVPHSCPFCPVECRPASSSTNRPTSSTGLVAAHLPSHQDRRTHYTRPKTAPTTKRELHVSRLPKHNNVRRGRVPYYTHFVSKLPLHMRDRTPSPPRGRMRQAFQEEQSPPPVIALDDEGSEEELEDDFLDAELNIEEDEVTEPVPAPVPSPIPSPAPREEPDTEPPPEVLEAWTDETVAPTPTPNASRRNSEIEPPPPTPPPPVPVVEEKAPSPVPSPPRSPSPPKPKSISPPPPTKAPSPTPPPPKTPTPPPPQLTAKPPKECAHKPKVPVPPAPKVKKEVRIQEPPPKELVIERKEKKPIEVLKKTPPEEIPKPVPLRPSLKKTPSEPKVEVPPPIKLEPERTPEPMPEPMPEPEKVPDETNSGPKDEPADEKKKMGPPPKVKVDVFSMDARAMKELLDLQMKVRRRGDYLSDDEDEAPTPDLASLIEPTTRMLRQSDWLRGRIALSRRAARFELPMDVGELAEMTPVEYLRRHCVLSQRRRALYKKAFMKVDKDNDGKINRKELEKAVLDALVDTIQPDKVATVMGYLKAEDQPIFTSRFFGAFCALLERLYYKEFTKEDIGDKKEEKAKEILEEADFTGLDWKLDGQYVNPALKKLLYML